jgi:very-short-patch-repair endonuclease
LRWNHPEMVRLLEGVGDGARSAAERVVAVLLRRARIRGWVANHPTAGYCVDVAFLEEMLAVEIDGMASHGGARAFQRDRTRRNALIAAGWTVLNFTWADLIERPTYVPDSIHQSLAALTDPRLRVL